MIPGESKTFCPLPWIHLDAKTSGDLRVCSPSSQGPGRGLLRDDGGDVYNLATSSIDTSRNSSLLMEIRQAILRGEFHRECHRCQTEEKAGILSRRQTESALWRGRFDYEDAIRFTAEDGSISNLDPSYYALRLGNHCNLRCRSCSPTDSDGWYDDYVSMNSFSGFRDGDRRLVLQEGPGNRFVEPSGFYRWHESESFWEELFAKVSSIRAVHLTGGEPFLIRRHYEFLRNCVESGHASHIALEYNTNGTLLPRELLSLWPSFEQVRIGVSIDGVGGVNDYLRHPSRFPNVENTLETLDSLGGNVIVWIACTVSLLNVYYLDELVKWKLLKGFKKVNSLDGRWPLLSAHPLHRPSELSIQVLPPRAKFAVAEKLATLPTWIQNFCEENHLASETRDRLVESGREMSEGYIKYLQAEDKSHLLPEFWRKTRKLDELRGQSLARSLPELDQLLM